MLRYDLFLLSPKMFFRDAGHGQVVNVFLFKIRAVLFYFDFNLVIFMHFFVVKVVFYKFALFYNNKLSN